MFNSRPENSDPIIAYHYQRSYRGYDRKTGVRAIIIQDEYFVPSLGICFSKDEIKKSDKPRNFDKEFYGCTTILKKVFLESELINAIHAVLDNNTPAIFYKYSRSKIFDKSLYLSSANEHDFEKNYTQHGSLILPDYILQYITNVNLDKNSNTVKRIFEIIGSLDEIEKQSLENCLHERLMKRDEMRKKFNIKENPVPLSTGVASLAVGATTAALSESFPLGVFAGGLVLFSMNKYDESLKNKCDEFKNKIFDALKTDKKICLVKK